MLFLRKCGFPDACDSIGPYGDGNTSMPQQSSMPIVYTLEIVLTAFILQQWNDSGAAGAWNSMLEKWDQADDSDKDSLSNFMGDYFHTKSGTSCEILDNSNCEGIVGSYPRCVRCLTDTRGRHNRLWPELRRECGRNNPSRLHSLQQLRGRTHSIRRHFCWNSRCLVAGHWSSGHIRGNALPRHG